MDLLVATRSAGKMAEIRRILANLPGVRLLSPGDLSIAADPAEEGLERFDSFEVNALSKATYFHARSGLPTVADDSGIEVDALLGAPGVRSKRFAPDPGLEGVSRDRVNNRYLVSRLAGVPTPERTARYVCVAVLVDGVREPLVVRGEATGLIVDEPMGTGGFGYDPHMLVPDLGRTFAQLSPDEKDARSHRGAAFRQLVEAMREVEA